MRGNGLGGGIYVARRARVHVTRSTITENEADGGAGSGGPSPELSEHESFRPDARPASSLEHQRQLHQPADHEAPVMGERCRLWCDRRCSILQTSRRADSCGSEALPRRAVERTWRCADHAIASRVSEGRLFISELVRSPADRRPADRRPADLARQTSRGCAGPPGNPATTSGVTSGQPVWTKAQAASGLGTKHAAPYMCHS